MLARDSEFPVQDFAFATTILSTYNVSMYILKYYYYTVCLRMRPAYLASLSIRSARESHCNCYADRNLCFSSRAILLNNIVPHLVRVKAPTATVKSRFLESLPGL